MAFDGDILQIKVFTEVGHTDAIVSFVESAVNKYLHNYPADLVHSIQAQISEGNDWLRYTVTVTLRS